MRQDGMIAAHTNKVISNSQPALRFLRFISRDDLFEP